MVEWWSDGVMEWWSDGELTTDDTDELGWLSISIVIVIEKMAEELWF